jgi:hypothetical protein
MSMGYGLDGWFDSWQEKEIFLLHSVSTGF